MPWKCPACGGSIRHDHELGPMPRTGTIYRCYVCRIELVLNLKTGKLVLAPLAKT